MSQGIMNAGSNINDMSVVTNGGLVPLNPNSVWVSNNTVGQQSLNAAIGGTITLPNPDAILDEFELNEITVEHKVTTHELEKLKETVDYNDIIKHNLAKMMSERVIEKARFTKKHDSNTDATSFRARVWVFNKEELIDFIKECRNVR